MVWQSEALRRLDITLPILQAPMAGANDHVLAAAVSAAGGLGGLPCAMLDATAVRHEVAALRSRTPEPFLLNFFCHRPAPPDPVLAASWRATLEPYYREAGLGPEAKATAPSRMPFDDTMCALVEELKPAAISFHFGLPEQRLLDRVRATGAAILGCATTVAEARWLDDRGVDFVVAQGFEAGGHRGQFLSDDPWTQVGTMALVPQVVDAVSVPVIASGGIADGRGVAAALVLGAVAVSIGTAFLKTPEARFNPLHREALATVTDDGTALTNLFSGRPARGITNRLMRELGPISDAAPPFPTAGAALAPLKAHAEAAGRPDFTSMWCGQAAALTRPMAAGELVHELAADASDRLSSLAG